MDFGSSYMPAETVSNILRYLSFKDNKNVRLVSKDLSVFAARFVFESLYISTKLRDRETFTAVSEHSLYSQLVKEVVYDSTNLVLVEGEDRFSPNRASYTRFLDNQFNFRCCSHVPARYSKASFQRGFKIFIKDFYEQNQLANYHRDDMTRFRDAPSLPPNFSSLLMDPKNHQDVVRYLPDDLVRLVRGLPRLPRVRRFKITDHRYSKNSQRPIDPHSGDMYGGHMFDCPNVSVSVNNEGVRGIDEVILNPRPWLSEGEEGEDSGCDRSWYRGFFVLTQAASMTNMGTLDSFKVETSYTMSGLSHVLFSMSQRELYHTMNAFSNLTTIQLKIHTGDLYGMTWEQTMAGGDLAEILGAAKHLETLDLRMDMINPDPVRFKKIIGTHTWPKLREVRLATVVFELDSDGFLEFFERHRHTLRSLWLEEVMILSRGQIRGLWPQEGSFLTRLAARREMEPYGRWKEILMAMALDAVALTNITYFESNFHISPSTWVFHSCNPATVFDFLRSGGTNRPTVPCQHECESLVMTTVDVKEDD